MNTLKTTLIFTLCTFQVLFSACSDDDDPLTPFSVNFSSAEVGISSDSPEAQLTVSFSRPSTMDGTIKLRLNSGDLVYGESEDFYASVAPQDDVISLAFKSGDQNVNFTVNNGSAANRTADATLVISIENDPDNLFIPGTTNQVSITFAENFISPGASLEMSAGDENFTQRAYVDLSKATSTSVPVDNFDLGFQTGSGFYVTLNSSANLMARPLDKNDLNDVSAADTAGFAAVMTIPPPNFDASIGSVAWVDTPDGDLSTTAFGEISATDTDNKVFIVKRNKGNWKKVRVLRNGEGYTLQHADIAATSFETLDITKDQTFEAVTVDLDQGIVEAEPENDKWDFRYGTYTEVLPLGPGASIPYGFKDLITINRSDVSIAMIMIADTPFESFSAADVAGLTFETAVNAIGNTWRMGGGPSSPPALHTDRYYIIKDGEENIYKLQFTRMYSLSDQRGEGAFKYELLN
ncbi:HmuY family protein [Fulvivirgaceae bacterium BMA12]|uniref:HmuY family protein n=1 Tax=Agaribacillus aureus TaxID=3051825 RepID=A0ABT8L5W5_9BACT|nr:HmuY family protein [Fulvivirgaceae bacterium BMA12]